MQKRWPTNKTKVGHRFYCQDSKLLSVTRDSHRSFMPYTRCLHAPECSGYLNACTISAAIVSSFDQ